MLLLFNTRETVAMDTPAREATSSIVTIFYSGLKQNVSLLYSVIMYGQLITTLAGSGPAAWVGRSITISPDL